MFKIQGNVISITRGDTGIFTLGVTDAQGNPYDYSNDTVLFTVRENVYAANKIMQKNIVYGQTTIIQPEDTANLNYGSYVYDVQIATSGGLINTVITPSPFNVKAEVTF